MVRVINAKNKQAWKQSLEKFKYVDVCHLPEYHEAYASRFSKSQALLWEFEERGEILSYPFLYTPVLIKTLDGSEIDTGFFDVSGIYGFSGPLSTSNERDFLNKAWQQFDVWSKSKKIICEFIRFSVYVKNHDLAHSKCLIEENRPISISVLPENSSEYFSQLRSNTKNMIRRALKEGFTHQEVDINESLGEFRALYNKTMSRTNASSFFLYNDEYYDNLLSIPSSEISLHVVYKDGKMISAALALIFGEYAFYHLGASDSKLSKLGAGNLVLFALAQGLIKKGVKVFNIGGGRTVALDDPLFKFKKSNGTSVSQFYIGKRILDEEAYNSIMSQWQKINSNKNILAQLQFYR